MCSHTSLETTTCETCGRAQVDVYDGTADFLRTLELDAGLADASAIIGTIGDIDSYQLPDAKGYTAFMRHLLGVSPMRSARRAASRSWAPACRTSGGRWFFCTACTAGTLWALQHVRCCAFCMPSCPARKADPLRACMRF